jgi:hypothetical protein
MATAIKFPIPKFGLSDRAEVAHWGGVELSHRGPPEPGVYLAQLNRGRWELYHVQHGLVGRFRTLREVLETVCRTIH